MSYSGKSLRKKKSRLDNFRAKVLKTLGCRETNPGFGQSGTRTRERWVTIPRTLTTWPHCLPTKNVVLDSEWYSVQYTAAILYSDWRGRNYAISRKGQSDIKGGGVGIFGFADLANFWFGFSVLAL